MNKKGFTLIELLVVVLIIGILSAIALPQYEKAVFKSRLAEVMINVRTIQNCFDEYVLTNGLPSSGEVLFENMGCAAELSGGTWSADASYHTKYFTYDGVKCDSTKCGFWAYDKQGPGNYFELIHNKEAANEKECYTENKSLGRLACKMFQDMGYTYKDTDY